MTAAGHIPRQELVSAASSAWLLMELWILLRSRRALRGEGRDRGSFAVLVLVIGASIGLAHNAPYQLPQLAIPFPAAILAVGLAAVGGGMALRAWAVLTLGAFFRVTVTVADTQRLVDTGPYARLRHPSYTGMLLTMAGLGLALGNWVSLAVMAAGGVLGLGWRIRVEEQALHTRFGAAWDAYAAKRWAVIPFVW